jgi:DEAD/DEAH box helicase domain-containing protein
MSIETLATTLRADANFIRNVTAWRTLPARGASTTAWPVDLNPRIVEVGRGLGIDALYTHQTHAVETALRGENVILTTGTASGKTLGYTLPLLNTLLRDPTATALLAFPTKALAHDQITAMEQWIGALQAPIALRPYDGDTPQRHRAAIRNEARILITNPDMLHLGILPHHTRWVRFFSGLRYIVLDELHTYRGIFGSHVANVLRRARRVARFYGAEPQFVSASATIANARALAEAVWEDPVVAVEEDGAPYGQRHVIFYNPPLLNPDLGLRASASGEAIKLTLKLLQAGVQTIVFARARMTVEMLLRELRERAGRAGFAPDAIQGYRGGYLPQERRAIERDLRNGKTRVVIATNALELGIDIGALDASILVGYPGTIAATRQQMGRAGRRAGASLSVLVATPSPLDQYLISHPEYFFGRSPEEARVNPDTLSLLASHLTCAAFELPFEPGEPFGKAQHAGAILEALSAEDVLHQRNGRFTWVGDAYPAQALSLRSATADNVVIQATLESGDPRGVIGTVDRISAPGLVHEGAVYLHSGEMYLIESLDWEQGIALARPGELDYYTIASSSTKVERLSVRRTLGALAVTPQITDEEVRVHTKPAAYRRVQQGTHETLGWGEINLPEQVMETEAFRLTLPATLVKDLAEAGVMLAPLDYGPAWPQIRETILVRDGRCCRLCGIAAQAGHPLDVHHLTGLRTFLAQYPRQEALRLAHAPENLLTVCPPCHRQLERARGARTALSGLSYLLRNLAPVFLMCDPGDLGTSVEARDAESGLPAIVVFDGVPGGAGLSPRLVDLWPRLVEATLERVQTCPCTDGCPSCVGPAGESEPGAKSAARQLLEHINAEYTVEE